MVSLLEINIMAALLIILILIIRAAFGNRLPKRLFTSLWLIVALRLILPFGIPVPLGFVPAAKTVPYIDRINGHSEALYYDQFEGTTYYKNNVLPDEAAYFVGLRNVLLAVSACALVITLAWVIIKHVSTRRRLSDALPCEDENVLKFVQGFGLKRNVRVLISERIASPITFGVIKPVIILPKERGEVDVTAAIAHEMAHIKYFDIPYKLLMTGLAVFYWYDPFVWVMLIRVNRDVEMACDSFAMSYCDCSREEYSNLLVSMAEKRVDMLSGSFGSGEIKLRVKSVMKSRKTGSIAVFVSVLIAACSLSVFASAHTGNRTWYELYTPTYLNGSGGVPQIWMKPQKYYLEGGTKDEYIEIYADNTVQVFGYDYIEELIVSQKEYYAESDPDMTAEEINERIEQIINDEYTVRFDELWNRRNPYKCLALPLMVFVDENGDLSSGGIDIKDENTLCINNKVYKAESPWHAGVYGAPDAVGITNADYICDDGSVLSVRASAGYTLYDGSGNVAEEGFLRPVHLGDMNGPILMATNIDKFPAEQPVGYSFDPETCTLTHSVSGKAYRIKTYALLS